MKLKGKSLMFVGHFFIRGQWNSFVCLVESVIPLPRNEKFEPRLIELRLVSFRNISFMFVAEDVLKLDKSILVSEEQL